LDGLNGLSPEPGSDRIDTVAALIDCVFDQSEATELSDDEQAGNCGFVIRRELRHVASHARAGHNHRDGSHGAGVGAEGVADTLVTVHDDGLAADHRQDITLRAHAGAGGAADAVIVVDVRVLRLRSVGIELALLRGLAGQSLPLLQASEVNRQKDEADDAADTEGKEGIHLLKIP